MKHFMTCILLILSAYIGCYAYSLEISTRPVSACIADLDNDGDQDIIIGHKSDANNTNPSISIIYNNGNCTFSVVDTTLTFAGYQDDLILHDINNDGSLDLVAQYGDIQFYPPILYFRVFNNFSTTNHSFVDIPMIRNDPTDKILCVDRSNDNHDICLISNVGHSWGFMHINNDGQVLPPVYYDLGFPPQDMTIGDYNSDGSDDIIIKKARGIRAWLYNTNAYQDTSISETIHGYKNLYLDIDQDNEKELINFNIYDPGGDTYIDVYHINNGTLTSTFNCVIDLAAMFVDPIDLNNDGYTDLLYNMTVYFPHSYEYLSYTWILYNNGQGGFDTPVSINTGQCSYRSYAADFDNNGFLDILTLNVQNCYPYPENCYMHIMYNDGNGGFQETSPTANDDNYITTPLVDVTCYPNPFNPNTEIAYSLKDTGKVSLDIYNVKGQLVKTLYEGNPGKGNFTQTWDGRDNAGTPCSSGVYFYKLRTTDKTLVRKMMLMK